MDPSGSYFESANEMYQINEFLTQKGKSSTLPRSYEELKFLIDNLQDLCNFVDYSSENVVYRIDPSMKPNLSEEQKISLNDDLKNIYLKGNLNNEVKKSVKKLLESNSIK